MLFYPTYILKTIRVWLFFWTLGSSCGIGVCCKEVANMPKTIIDTILNPDYQKECNFRNLKEKVELCEELKQMESEITSQLDREHKILFGKYAEAWDKLHTELNLDSFASGMKFAELHNR